MFNKSFAFLSGVVSASIIMFLCEYINSLIFPFPANLDLNNIEAVRSFAQNLPWTAYLLVLFGWYDGSFFAGWISSKISKNNTKIIPILIGIFLTISGIMNFIMLQHPLWVVIIGLPAFIPLTILGSQMGQKNNLKN